MAAKMIVIAILVLGCFATLNSAFDEVPSCDFFSTEKLAYPANCGLYVQCAIFSSDSVKACPAGMVFNPKTSDCDLAKNVPECDGGGFLVDNMSA